MDLLAIFEAERLAAELATGAPYKATIEDLRSFLERSVYNDPATAVLANFKQIAGEKPVSIHPIVARSVDPEVLQKLRVKGE